MRDETTCEQTLTVSFGNRYGASYLSDFVMIPCILFKADVVKPGVVIQWILLDLSLILESPFTNNHVLQ